MAWATYLVVGFMGILILAGLVFMVQDLWEFLRILYREKQEARQRKEEERQLKRAIARYRHLKWMQRPSQCEHTTRWNVS